MFSTGPRWRSAVADTFALVVYCFVIGMVIEVVISGMTFRQSLSSRLLSIPVNILIAWPYGMYRDAFIRFAQRHAGQRFGHVIWLIYWLMSVSSHRFMP